MKYKKTLVTISSLLLAGAAFAADTDTINVTIHNNTDATYRFVDLGAQAKSVSVQKDAGGFCTLTPAKPVNSIPPHSTVTLPLQSEMTMGVITTKVDTPVSGKSDLTLLNIYPGAGNDQNEHRVLFSSFAEKMGTPYDSNSPAIASVTVKNEKTSQTGTLDTRFKVSPSVSGTCRSDAVGPEDTGITCTLLSVMDSSLSITINPSTASN